MRFLIKSLLNIIFFPLKFIIPKGKVITVSTSSPHIYCGNTRYLYEYLSKNCEYKVFWHTENESIKQYLDNLNFKYISISKPIHYIWTLLRTKIVINDGDAYINTFKILDNNSTIKICTFHGSAAKAALYTHQGIISVDEQIDRINKFNFVNFPSKYTSITYRNMFNLPQNKVISFGFPRCDQFFNYNYTQEAYKQKKISKLLNPNINNKTKIILYTPTWRPYKYNLPIIDMTDFNAESMNLWLEDNNACFFYTVHSGVKPSKYIKDYSRIYYINLNNHPLFDINTLMMETDLLLNDYSATSTDYSLLNKAHLFFMPDYKNYWGNEDITFIKQSDNSDSYDSYRKSLPGDEVDDFSSLIEKFEYIFSNYEKYVNKYNSKSQKLLSDFYSINNRNSCVKFKKFIQNII
ncbi:MAG: hypothetical protein CMD88_02290 [Gammaproteobacteria bacterium]|nr:hypothetical protein [Gammaproteobacteria bacterium]|tara:strand:+ start:10159 stop:11379 length:1221 start_codon:yes stop_codon:yes gene_type:complete